MIPFKVCSAPRRSSAVQFASYVDWGTSSVRVAGANTYKSDDPQQHFRLTALSSGTVGGATEYDLRIKWELFDGTSATTATETGTFSVGHDYTVGDWIGISCGLRVAINTGTITEDGTALIPDSPRSLVPPDYEEIDFSDVLFGDSDVWPEFGVAEEGDRDIVRDRPDGSTIRIPRVLKRNLWVRADALPVAYRRKLVRWVEEGRRLSVLPSFDRSTAALYPLQDSISPIIGPEMNHLAPEDVRAGHLGYYESRDGIFRPSPLGVPALFGNMEPLGRGMFTARTTYGSAWENFVTAPSSPTGSGSLGWTVPGTDSGTFDDEIDLPVEGDPGALRWKVGAGSTGITRSVSGLTASSPYCFSVFVRGRSGETNDITISCSPASGSIPENSTTVVLSGEWQRVFICGNTDGSGAATLKIEGETHSVVYVCGAQLELLLWGRYSGPSPYDANLDSDYIPRSSPLSRIEDFSLPFSQGRVSGFFRPGFLGGSSSGRVYLVRAGTMNNFSIGIDDPSGAGTSLTFFGRIGGGAEVTVAVTDFEPDDVFFVAFTWAAISSSGYLLRIDVFSDRIPDGESATATTGTTSAGDAGTLYLHESSVSNMGQMVSLLRVDYGSSLTGESSATWAADQYNFWTGDATKEIGRIVLGREFELALGAMKASAGNPNYIDAALRLIERRVNESAPIGGRML